MCPGLYPRSIYAGLILKKQHNIINFLLQWGLLKKKRGREKIVWAEYFFSRGALKYIQILFKGVNTRTTNKFGWSEHGFFNFSATTIIIFVVVNYDYTLKLLFQQVFICLFLSYCYITKTPLEFSRNFRPMGQIRPFQSCGMRLIEQRFIISESNLLVLIFRVLSTTHLNYV